MEYIKPIFFKLGNVATLTKGGGSKNVEETSTETENCAGQAIFWSKTTYAYKY